MNFIKTKLLMLILIGLMSQGLISCDGKKKSGRIEVKTPAVEPQFKKEGVLTFFNNGDTVKTIDIEIADNYQDRAQGMMYRTSMDYGKGMLFVFDEEEEQSFWMKNTKMSLDIIYINGDMEIVSIFKHTQPYSESPIPSIHPAMFVVETAAGFCDKFGIEEGNSIEFALSQEEVPA